MPSLLSFEVDRTVGVASLIPTIDGNSLIDLVASFETARGYNPARGYAGLIPAHFNFGDLTQYYKGSESQQWSRPGYAWLLACDCGEVGCWPLGARITLSLHTVSWSNFEQPHRPAWDYNGFGPFHFDRAQYEIAVTDCVRESDV